MSELLGLGREPRPIAWTPLPVAPRTFWERFALDYEAERATGLSISRERNYALGFEAARQALAEDAPELANPYAAFAGGFGAQLGGLMTLSPAERARIEERERAWDEAVERLRGERPELADRLADAGTIRRRADERARSMAEQAEAASGFGGGLGGFLGTAAAIFTDPVQVLALPLGVGRLAGTVLRQMGKAGLIEGGVAAGVQAGVEVGAGAYRAEIGAPGDSAERIAAAAAGGFVIGGALRGLIAGAERALARGALDPAAAIEVQAAASAARAEEALQAANPAGPEAASAHRQAADEAVQAVARGEQPRVEVPPPAQPDAAAQRLAGLSRGELDAHVRAAIEDVLATRGSRRDAAWRQDLGAITLDWGTPGDPTRDFRGGFGLAHIVAKRQAEGLDGEAWLRTVMPVILMQGRIARVYGPADGLRVDLEANGQRLVLSLFRAGQRENWVVTGFPVQGRGGPDGTGGVNPAPPYAPAPSGIQATAGAGPPLDSLAPGPRRFKVYAPTGRAVLVETRAVELDALIVSHGPDGRLNPAYPHAEGVQPRDRGSAPSQDQVREIAAKLIPDRLRPNVEGGLGAPIIGPDLAVESGNARVAALSLIYGDARLAEQRAAYRAMVEAVDPGAARLRAPVLVSARITPLTPAERAAWARELNGRPVAGATISEEARLDAGILGRLTEHWRGGEVDGVANAEFVRRFLDALGPEERATLLDRQGRLTALGKQRIERGLLAAAYGDELGPLLERLLTAEGEGYRALAAALREVAGDWAAMRAEAARGTIPSGFDLTPQVAEAVRWLDEARLRKLPVRELLAQLDLDRPPPTDLARAFLAAIHTRPDMTGWLRGRERIAELLRGYIDQARQHRAGPNMFGLAPPTEREVLEAVARRALAEPAEVADAAAARGVAEQAPEPSQRPPQPETLAAPVAEAAPAGDARLARLAEAEAAQTRLAADPATEAAEFLEAQRIAADRDLAVPVDDTGAVRGARELLDEIEAETRQAAEAAACLIGGAAPAAAA
jgi:hypothetical protein